MTATIKLRRGTASEWSVANPTPASGEPCFETDTGVLKIGDGTTAYNSLTAIGTGAEQFIDLTDVPSSYSGHGSKFVKVKSDASGLEFVTGSGSSVAWGDITGTLSGQTDLQTALNAKVTANVGITGATKTKITYDAKGLVTSGVDATTADIADSTNKRYVTDAQLVVIGNTSGTNTGDQDLSGLMVKANNLSDLVSASTARTNLGLGSLATQSGTFSGTSSGTNTGDQTSIVGIAGTKAQFNTACTDGDFLYSGDIINAQYATINLVIDGGGSAITAGIKTDLLVGFNCTIIKATLLADQTGSIVIDIWKDSYSNYPATVADSIVSSAKPTLSSASKSQDSTLTGWTTSLTKGDILRFNVDSASTVTRAVLILEVTRV